jgi:hypothetical protein
LIETILFAVLCAALCTLRALVSLWAVDPATGFYEGHAPLVFAQNALWAAEIAVFLLLSLLHKKDRWSFPGRFLRGIPLAVAGAAFIGCSSVMLIENLLRFTEGDSSVKLSGILLQVIGIAAGLVMAGASLRLCRGRRNGSGILPAAFPALYMALAAVQSFLSYPTIASISDQQLEICTLSAGAFFFLAHARVLSGERGTAAVSYARGWGFCFALSGLSLCLGQQLATASGDWRMTVAERLLLALLSLYAAAFSCPLHISQRQNGYISQ